MRRHILGLIALASFAWAIILAWYPSLATYQAAGAIGLRMGLICGAFWLAWPDLHRLPPWVWYVLPIGILALIYARGILLYLSPVIAAAIVAYLLYRRVWRSPRR